MSTAQKAVVYEVVLHVTVLEDSQSTPPEITAVDVWTSKGETNVLETNITEQKVVTVQDFRTYAESKEG
jgi:hypothetical protein